MQKTRFFNIVQNISNLTVQIDW